MTALDRSRPDVSAGIDVMRPPDQVWAAVADPHRLAGWSPETMQARSTSAGPLPVGARFRGTNARGARRWSTTCVVVESAPGRTFTFDVIYLGLSVSRWRFVVTPIEGGCRVEEQWWERRGAVMKVLSGIGTGVTDRPAHNLASMEATLRALKAELEVGR